MKKHFFWTVLICSAMISCKKDSTTVNSNVMEPLKQTKVIDDMFFNQDVRKFVKLIPEIKGYSPAKLFQVEKKDAGIHKYLLYLNGDEKARPIVILSKAENVHLFDLTKIDLSNPIHFFDEMGQTINGILQSKRNNQKVEAEQLASKEIGTNEICIDWYWIIVDEQTGEVVSEIFIETKCYSQAEGGGGGGGNPTPAELCQEQQEADFNEEVTGAKVTAETESIEIYRIGPFEKAKNPKWKILSGLGGWSLHSKEIGVIKLVDAENNIWNWKSLQHGNITMQGSPLPGTSISFTQGNATVNLYSLYAGMLLDFNVTYSFVCNCPGIPIINTLVPPVHANYVATSIWDANPQ